MRDILVPSGGPVAAKVGTYYCAHRDPSAIQFNGFTWINSRWLAETSATWKHPMRLRWDVARKGLLLTRSGPGNRVAFVPARGAEAACKRGIYPPGKPFWVGARDSSTLYIPGFYLKNLGVRLIANQRQGMCRIVSEI
jgi:hypothetical protein